MTEITYLTAVSYIIVMSISRSIIIFFRGGRDKRIHSDGSHVNLVTPLAESLADFMASLAPEPEPYSPELYPLEFDKGCYSYKAQKHKQSKILKHKIL